MLIKQKALPRQGFAIRHPAGLSGDRLDTDRAALERALDFELDHTVYFGKQGMVLAHADVIAGMIFGAALANDDVAGDDLLTAIALDAQSFGL